MTTPFVPPSASTGMMISHEMLTMYAPFVLILSGVIALSLTLKVNLKSQGATCMTMMDKTIGLFTAVVADILVLVYMGFIAFHLYQAGWKENRVVLGFMGMAGILLLVSIFILLFAIGMIQPSKIPADDCTTISMLGACKSAGLMSVIAGLLLIVAVRRIPASLLK